MKLLSLFIGVCLLFANRSSATTRYVDLNGKALFPPYTSWAGAATNIQQALDVAQSGDVVLVTNGVYRTGGLGGARAVVFNAITLQSVNGPAVTSIEGFQVPGTTNGSGALRCVYLNDPGARLVGFTLTNGAVSPYPYDQGGGVYCVSANCVISNCVITGNSARFGGGAYSGRLIKCVIANNQAISLGAGGGAYSSVLINCLVKGNWAGYIGGGTSGCDATNSTITGNHAEAHAGGVSGGNIVNSIVYNNTVYDFSNSNNGDNWSEGTMLYCCTRPLPAGTGNFTNAPLFVDVAGGNFRLQAGSPCINAGVNQSAVGSSDFEGNPRIAGGTVDLGAYEFQSPSSVLSYAWLQQHTLPMDGTADYADGDADGWSNWNEWRSGTNPTNAASLLRVLGATTNALGVMVSWQSVTNRNYFLERASVLSLPIVFQQVKSNLVGQAGATLYTDTNAIGAGPYFYRVGVVSGQ